MGTPILALSWRCLLRRLPFAPTLLPGLAIVALCAGPRAAGQETPYIVTYSHHLEQPGNLDIEFYSNYATQKGGGDSIAPWVEIEYGATAWWTTELYVDSQTTFGDSAVYTGIRWENRFRPLMREHWINPVIYAEFENITGADKTTKEVVGSDNQFDHAVPNSEAGREHLHEIEAKLILSSDFKGWNISENFTSEKNLAHAPWEFGYAAGASRPFRFAATPNPCNFCAENFVFGAEAYGGLGTTDLLTLHGTSHYLAPIVAWQLPSGATFTLSPGFGLNGSSHRFILRWGISYEISRFDRRARSLFR